MNRLGMDTKNMNQANERFLSREPVVLLPIVCMMLLRGIGSSVDQQRFFGHLEEEHLSKAYEYYGVLSTIALLPGMMLVPFLSDIHGRKPVFVLLYTLALLSSILSYLPFQQPWVMMGNFIVATMKGGVLTITALSICEYCTPKHRFACLVANEVVKIFSDQATSFLYSQKILSKESSYVSLCAVLLAVACLVSVYWWPESPYWLASQGRREESKAALLWLRREGRAARAELATLETARRRPSPNLFWSSLLMTILAVTTAKCAASEEQILNMINNKQQIPKAPISHRIINSCVNVVVSLLIVFISYKVKRRVLYLCAAVIPLVLVYTLSIWIFAKQVGANNMAFYITTLICNSLLVCGTFNLNFVVFIEVVPQKYYTYLSCIGSIYFYGVSLIFPTLNIVYSDRFPLHGSLFLFATLSLVASALFYWLSQETRGKNLLEIERNYMTRLYHDNPEQLQVVELEDVSRL